MLEKIRTADMLSPDMREALLKVINELPEGNLLNHGDFHLGNVLITELGMMVIDRIDSIRSNPLADVARSSLLIDKSPLPEGTPVPSKWGQTQSD